MSLYGLGRRRRRVYRRRRRVVRRRRVYRRRVGGMRRHRMRRYRRGGSFFSRIGNALSSAHSFIKNNKIISTVGNALGSVGVPYAGAIGKAASVLGYGRRRRYRRRAVRRRRPMVRRLRRGSGRRVYRRRVHRRRGGSLRSLLSSGHRFVKDNRLVSKALSHFGHSKLASAASSLGYGRRRYRRRRVHRRRRGGSLRSLLSSGHRFVRDNRLVSKALNHFGHSKLASAASALGYGRMRHRGGANFFSTYQLAAPKF